MYHLMCRLGQPENLTPKPTAGITQFWTNPVGCPWLLKKVSKMFFETFSRRQPESVEDAVVRLQVKNDTDIPSSYLT